MPDTQPTPSVPTPPPTTTLLAKLKAIWDKVKGWVVVVALAVQAAVAFVLFMKWRNAEKEQADQVKDLTDQHHKDLDALTKTYQEGAEEQEKIELQYRDLVDKLRKENSELLTHVEGQRKEEVKQILAETGDDPDKVAARLSAMFGIPVDTVPKAQ